MKQSFDHSSSASSLGEIDILPEVVETISSLGSTSDFNPVTKKIKKEASAKVFKKTP